MYNSCFCKITFTFGGHAMGDPEPNLTTALEKNIPNTWDKQLQVKKLKLLVTTIS